MKVAIVNKTFDTRRGGAEVWSVAFARWLVSQGHDVHVVVRKSGDIVPALGATLHTIPAWSAWGFATKAARRLPSLGCDIIHDMGCGWHFDVLQSHVGSPLAYREKLLELKSTGSRLFKQARFSLPPLRSSKDLIDRQFAGPPHAIYIAVSNMVAGDLQSHHNIAEENIAVVHNGVDGTRFAPVTDGHAEDAVRRELGIASNDLVLLFVALHPGNKGVQTLVQVAARLLSEGHGIHVVIVGGVPTANELTQVRKSGVHERVHWIGRVDDPTPYYHTANVCMHLTPYDACSLVVLEALASGLPVITTQNNGAGELVEDGVCGYVTRDAGDADEAYQHMRSLLDADVRHTMGRNARAVAEKLTLEHNFRNIVEVYHRVLRRKGLNEPPQIESTHRLPLPGSTGDETRRRVA